MLDIAQLREGDIAEIVRAFADLGWNKPASQYEAYLGEQSAARRAVLVAREDGAFAGYVTLKHRSARNVPEIQDLNVLPRYRRRGIGSALLAAAEAAAARASSHVMIAVGLTADYGAAQQLYIVRGYVPDGHGITRGGRPIDPRETVVVDDDLVLTLTKNLRPKPASTAPSPPQ
jgi:GNAT superfamily N-acetyltransferase